MKRTVGVDRLLVHHLDKRRACEPTPVSPDRIDDFLHGHRDRAVFR